MPDSAFVFEEGEAVQVGTEGENEVAFESGEPITDTGVSDVVFEAGVGIGGVGIDLPPDLEEWPNVGGDLGDSNWSESHNARWDISGGHPTSRTIGWDGSLGSIEIYSYADDLVVFDRPDEDVDSDDRITGFARISDLNQGGDPYNFGRTVNRWAFNASITNEDVILVEEDLDGDALVQRYSTEIPEDGDVADSELTLYDPGSVFARPMVSDDFVYQVHSNGGTTKLTKNEIQSKPAGSWVWEYTPPSGSIGGVTNGIAEVHGTILIAYKSSDGSYYIDAVDDADGSVKWRHEHTSGDLRTWSSGSERTSGPIRSNGDVVVYQSVDDLGGSNLKRFNVIDFGDGSDIWSMNPGGEANRMWGMDKERIYTAQEMEIIEAYDLSDGSFVWQYGDGQGWDPGDSHEIHDLKVGENRVVVPQTVTSPDGFTSSSVHYMEVETGDFMYSEGVSSKESLLFTEPIEDVYSDGTNSSAKIFVRGSSLLLAV